MLINLAKSFFVQWDFFYGTEEVYRHSANVINTTWSESGHIMRVQYFKKSFNLFSPSKPHQESFGKRCTYKVPKTSTNVKLVTTIDRNGAETKRVQCEYCPKTHINVPVYNLHVNTGLLLSLTFIR